MRYSVVLKRVLETEQAPDGEGKKRVTLEIGVPELPLDEELVEGCAGFRIVPLTDWKPIFGVDAIQATYLAIQIGEQEAMRLGADWPDEAPDN